jgi:hypothetical protein
MMENNKSVELPLDFGSSAGNGYRSISKYVPVNETKHMDPETSSMVDLFLSGSLRPG